MASNTFYGFLASPRSSWMEALATYTGHNVKVVDVSTISNYAEIFPLHKTPAYVTPEGEKLTELIAIVHYFILGTDKKEELLGNSDFDTIHQLRWLSYFNSDPIICLAKLLFSPYPEEVTQTKEDVKRNLKWVDDNIAEVKTKFLVKDTPMLCDIYAYIVAEWFREYGFDLQEYKHLLAHMEAVKDHPIIKSYK